MKKLKYFLKILDILDMLKFVINKILKNIPLFKSIDYAVTYYQILNEVPRPLILQKPKKNNKKFKNFKKIASFIKKIF